jgi:hypothetical protein
MAITHILVDFENVQPSAADIGLVRGENLRLAIFRGPGQMKYSADVAEAWQPLGANVTFIRCAKAGRNASDMHIAFYLGEMVAAQPRPGDKTARFVIVSRDTDFDPLLLHVRSLGYEATRVASIRAALGGKDLAAAESKATKRGSARLVGGDHHAAGRSQGDGRKAAAAAPRRRRLRPLLPRRHRRSHRDQVARHRRGVTKVPSLQRMGEKRPAKRKGLERHIESHLGRNLEPGQLETLMTELERDGVLVFNDKNKVEYRLSKARK